MLFVLDPGRDLRLELVTALFCPPPLLELLRLEKTDRLEGDVRRLLSRLQEDEAPPAAVSATERAPRPGATSTPRQVPTFRRLMSHWDCLTGTASLELTHTNRLTGPPSNLFETLLWLILLTQFLYCHNWS